MELNREQELLTRLQKYLYRSGEDQPPLAQHLLDRYGSLRCLLQNRQESLQQECGLSELPAQLISNLPALTRYTLSERFRPPSVLDCFDRIQDFLASLYLGKPYEELHIIVLNEHMQLNGCRMIQQGTMREVSMPVRQVVETVCALDARYVLLSHNHPSENDEFSIFDLDTTRTFLEAMSGIGIPVLDHVLYAGHRCLSMRSTTMVPEEQWMNTGIHNLSREKWLRLLD